MGTGLLGTFSGQLEAYHWCHLVYFLKERNILSTSQRDFGKGFSTVTQLVQVVHYLISAIRDKMQTVVILLDFREASDKVSHKTLTQKANTTFKNNRAELLEASSTGSFHPLLYIQHYARVNCFKYS